MVKKIFLLAATVSALPATASSYDINYPVDTKIATDSNRRLVSVSLDDQTAAVGQESDRLLYHDLSDTAVFSAEAGAEVKPSMQWNGTWMHGYVYIDLNGDGSFDPVTELLSYTYLNGRNSIGVRPAQDCGPTDLPAFVIPALEKGDYRMRYVVDWDYADPMGRNTAQNSIVSNNGAIADVTLRVTATQPEAAEPYAINYAANAKITHSGRRLHSLTLSSALMSLQTVNVGQDTDRLLYHDCTDTEVIAVHGEEYTLGLSWTGTWMNTYLYIDRAGNGDFSAQLSDNGTPLPGTDLIAFSNYNNKNSNGDATNDGNNLSLPSFRIPAELKPGKYRARLKIDWDNVDPAGAPDDAILTHGGAIVDFTLDIPDDEILRTTINPMAMNGLLLRSDGQPIPEMTARGFDLTVKALPTLPGFETDHLIIRHGEGDSMTDTEVAIGNDGIATIPGDIIDCDEITIYALFAEQADSEWSKVWGDEFSADKMDTRRWQYHPRYNATWNRLIAQGVKQQKLVNTFGNGYYNAWCIATPEEFTDETQPMISGAIYSQGKFSFHYGKIEARIKTRPHTGNFPAFWLMPAQNAEGGWPLSGEIDIWEQINSDNAAHSTIHSGWTGWKIYCNWPEGPKQASPRSTNNIWVDAAAWHIFALEWDEETLRFYVDGKLTFTYANQHYSEPGTNYTENICWPFYKDFYIILNQSVGNGSWASNPDTGFEYLTQFDYVRVYKKKGDNGMTSTVKDNGDDPNFYVPLDGGKDPGPIDPDDPDSSIETIGSDDAEAPAVYFDMNGRRIVNPAAGGVYLRKEGNRTSKVIL